MEEMDGKLRQLVNAIVAAKSVQDLKRFYEESRGNFYLEVLYEKTEQALKSEEQALKSEERALKSEERALKSKALRDGSYFEDVDGLWEFTAETLPSDIGSCNNLFQKIARSRRPDCYTTTRLFTLPPPASTDPLPTVTATSVGTNSLFLLEDFDIFGNAFIRERAHNAPDSVTCAPSWGHAVEGATGTIPRQHRHRLRNKERKQDLRHLLIMGVNGQEKETSFRYSPFNFIRFSKHDEFYDKAPHIMFLPILTLEETRNWNNTPYDAIAVASAFDGKPAKEVYRSILANGSSECSEPKIKTATTSLVDFMKGLAGSLLNETPIELAKLSGNTEKANELIAVKEDIERNGITLPHFREGRSIRPVLMVRFDRKNPTDPIADPWMLFAKAAVNLSWLKSQKLLPTCKPRVVEDEGDLIFWQNMADYEAHQRAISIPSTIISIPLTPKHSEGSGAAQKVTPEKEDEDWEYMD